MWIAVLMMLACGGGEAAPDGPKDTDAKEGAAVADGCTVGGVVLIDNKLHPGSYAWAERKPGSKVALMQGGTKVAEGETEREGAFKFEAVAPGKYEVKGHRKGFKAMTVPVECAAGGEANAKLFLELTAKGFEDRGKRKSDEGKSKKGG